jgi:plastocyanin
VDAKRRALLRVIAGGGGAALLGGLPRGAQSSGAPAAGTTHTVAIDAMAFTPAVLTLRPGERVTWTNHDPFPHTATADGGGFDSKEIAPAASFTYVAAKPGVYPYGCTLHPTMRATLVVEPKKAP